jgi:hypothetical protein
MHTATAATSENARKLHTMFAHTIAALHQLEARTLAGAFTQDQKPLLQPVPETEPVTINPSVALLKELQSVRLQLERSAFNMERQALRTNSLSEKLADTERLLEQRTSALQDAQVAVSIAENQVEVLTNAVRQLTAELSAKRAEAVMVSQSSQRQVVPSVAESPLGDVWLDDFAGGLKRCLIESVWFSAANVEALTKKVKEQVARVLVLSCQPRGW